MGSDARKPMWVLTIHQPFADLVVDGTKIVENRTRRTSIRERVAIHAGMSRQQFRHIPTPPPLAMAFGALLGTVEIYDCVTPRDAAARLGHRWDIVGPWCYLLRDPERYDTPVPMKGRQGWWTWGRDDPFRAPEPVREG